MKPRSKGIETGIEFVKRVGNWQPEVGKGYRVEHPWHINSRGEWLLPGQRVIVTENNPKEEILRVYVKRLKREVQIRDKWLLI